LASFSAKAQHILPRYAVGAGYNVNTREVVLTTSINNALIETQFSNEASEKTLSTLVGWEIPFRKNDSWNYFSITPKVGLDYVTYNNKPYNNGYLIGDNYFFSFGLNLNYTYNWIRVSTLFTTDIDRIMFGLSVSVNIH
jgi:hypothetical protein